MLDDVLQVADMIRRQGTRGGSHVTEASIERVVDALLMVTGVHADELYWKGARVLAILSEAVAHVEACQEKADAYDYTEYMEQIPRIRELQCAVMDVLLRFHRA